ncbi:PDZ domain-containing guanine nucleotide exchange factor, partial [Carabus blaptoides fortunei]
VVSDETRLHEMSLECEGSASTGSTNGSIGSSSHSGAPRGRRHASPAPSTTSSASSASDERKPSGNKFGAASPQAVRKLLSLSEPNKTRPHQPRQPPNSLGGLAAPQPSPAVRRAPSATGSYSSYGSHCSTGSGGGGTGG